MIMSQKKIISKVVDSYSQIRNPFELVRKTHEEDPWKNTDLNQEIECDEIRKYYENNRKRYMGYRKCSIIILKIQKNY